MKGLFRGFTVGVALVSVLALGGCPGVNFRNNTFTFKVVSSACPIRVASMLILPLGAGVDDLDAAVHVRDFLTPLEDGVVISRRIPPGTYFLAIIFDVGDGIPRLLIHNIEMDFTGASSSTLFEFLNIDWRAELRMSPDDCDRGFLDYFIDGNLASNGSFSVSDAFLVVFEGAPMEGAGEGIGEGMGEGAADPGPKGYGIVSEVYRADL